MATVRLVLNHPTTHVYTNLDNLSGKVVLNLETQDTISEIVVKLEGVLTTKLTVPTENNQKERKEVDEHKVLYQTSTVFPSEAVRRQQKSSHVPSYTLNAGIYEYPFGFKIPINNSCLPMTGWLSKLNMSQRAQQVQPRKQHLKSTLPPSLTVVSGNEQAKVRYYVKVTVKRPSFLKINPREESTFVFCPIEPPRPPATGQEIFAKREHQFVQAPKKKKQGLFASLRGPSNDGPITKSRFSIEARLPAPAIISHSKPLPLRIIVKKLEEFDHPIFFRGIQLRLLSKTHIECYDIQRDVYGALEFLSNYSLKIPVGYEESTVNKEIEVDSSPWNSCHVPTTVAPTFASCNISRVYLLEIVIGVSVGDMEFYDTIPLQIPVSVYSGIEPPKELLKLADGAQPPASTSAPTPSKSKMDTEKATLAANGSSASTSQSASAAAPEASGSAQGIPHPSDPAPAFDQLGDAAPPPTYDEATIPADISDLPPVSGPRREYPQNPDYFRQEKS